MEPSQPDSEDAPTEKDTSPSPSAIPPSRQLPEPEVDLPSATSQRESRGANLGQFPDDSESPPEYSTTLDYPRQMPSALQEQPKAQLNIEVDQLFVLRDLDKGEAYLRRLPSQHHWRLVNKLVASAIASNKISDVRLVGDLFGRAVSKNLIMPDAFVTGFTPSLDTLDIITSYTPNAASFVAIMLKAAQLDSERLTGLVHQVEGSNSEILVGLLL